MGSDILHGILFCRSARCVLTPSLPQAVKISGLKSARTGLQNSAFSGHITNLFSTLCVLTDILSCQCEKANKQHCHLKTASKSVNLKCLSLFVCLFALA